MAHFHRYVIGVLTLGTLLAGCREGTGPGIEGRWAARGIELITQPGTTELQLICTSPARLTHGILPDSAGTIRFSTLVQPLAVRPPYRVDFLGTFVGNALYATVTRNSDATSPSVQTYVMLPNGDPGFAGVFCAM
jgi:hypothetical protein